MNGFRAPSPTGDLAGTVVGTGPEVLLLHGGPGLSDYLGPLAEELRDSYTVATYTQRGLDPSAVDGDISVAGHVADAVAVAKHLGWERPIVGGHSWGGHLTLHLLARHPGRWRAALVVDPLGAVGDGGLSQFAAEMRNRIPAATRSRVEELDAIEEKSGSLPPDLQMEYLRLVWPAYFPDPGLAPPMPELQIATHQAQMWADMMAALPALEAGLAGCAVPTIFVHGELSPLPVTASTESADLMVNAAVDVIEGAGHFIWMDAPGAVRRSLDRLVNGLR
ncbi:alpha/beta fold hydrolase [Nocardioides antri]|uniref:Alpha/beta hydrolase n=1 Tax=Nocardioides antri TaxID=2607659 RepID=A0A5B1M6N2_9ACTN|nr:alpha/beta hydrolase [Nocardioides antri]KAA1428491.1 alpha/beta hydrolase [Nocardioides antri]